VQSAGGGGGEQRYRGQDDGGADWSGRPVRGECPSPQERAEGDAGVDGGRGEGGGDGDPAAQLIGVVRAASRDVGTPGYRGCAFLNAAAEYPDSGHPVHELCAAHVTGIAAVLHQLATDAGLQDPQAVTDRLMLVVNGLRASGAALGTPAVTTAVSLAKDIVRLAAPAA
jgi:hypothetical protein